jgi:hypothetical protein
MMKIMIEMITIETGLNCKCVETLVLLEECDFRSAPVA